MQKSADPPVPLFFSFFFSLFLGVFRGLKGFQSLGMCIDMTSRDFARPVQPTPFLTSYISNATNVVPPLTLVYQYQIDHDDDSRFW
jgi:hypothetical protein